MSLWHSLWISHYCKFFSYNPALIYGLNIFLGFFASFQMTYTILLPFILLAYPSACSIPKQAKIRTLLASTVAICAFFYGHMIYSFPTIPEKGLEGKAHIDITAIRATNTHFSQSWAYRGTVRSFTYDGKRIASNIPYTMHLPRTGPRPPADKEYILNAKLMPTESYYYRLKPLPSTFWHPIRGSRSLVERRLKAKTSLAKYVHKHIKHPRSAAFLTSLITGEFHDRYTLFEFGKLGLQHIMAISGFHFSIIAGMIALFLRAFLSYKNASRLLLLFLTSYFVFIGCTPSILRAWISIMIVLCGQLIGKPPSSLNTLGVALVTALIYDPMVCQNLGFQFSFIATGAILLLYAPFNKALEFIFPSRTLPTALKMDHLNQWGYILVSIMKKAMALTLAVHAVTIPIMLLNFHRFPILGLIMNLFFPLLVSVAITTFLLAIAITAVIPPVGEIIHGAVSVYTSWIVNFAISIPTTLNFVWRVKDMPLSIFTIYMCLLCIGGIIMYNKSRDCDLLLYPAL